MMAQVRTAYNQDIFDVAIVHYGSAEGIFSLMVDNVQQIGSINAELMPGTLLSIKSAPVDELMKSYLKGMSIDVATAATAEPFEDGFLLTESGIVLTDEMSKPLAPEAAEMLLEDMTPMTDEEGENLTI